MKKLGFSCPTKKTILPTKHTHILEKLIDLKNSMKKFIAIVEEMIQNGKYIPEVARLVNSATEMLTSSKDTLIHETFPSHCLHSSWLSGALELDRVKEFLKKYPSGIKKSELFFSRTLFGRASEPFFFHFANKKLHFRSNQSLLETRPDFFLKVMERSIMIEEDKSAVLDVNPDGEKIVKLMGDTWKATGKPVFGILWEGTMFETYKMDEMGFHVFGQEIDVLTDTGAFKLMHFLTQVYEEVFTATKAHETPMKVSQNNNDKDDLDQQDNEKQEDPDQHQPEPKPDSDSSTNPPPQPPASQSSNQQPQQNEALAPCENIPTFVVKKMLDEDLWFVKSSSVGRWMVYKRETARVLSDGIPREIRILTDLEKTGKDIAPKVIQWGWVDSSREEYWVLMPRYCQDDPTTLEQLFQYVKGVLNCLKVVHQLNIVHRDMKPDNICYNSKTHKVVLIDYNHSTYENFKEPLLILFNLFGQGNTKWRNCDQRGDLWNLGNIIKYYLEKIPSTKEDPLNVFLGRMQKMLTTYGNQPVTTTIVLNRLQALEVKLKSNTPAAAASFFKSNVSDKENQFNQIVVN